MAYDIDNARTKDTHCEALLKAATPELYRQNAFRVLGVSVNATSREIERHRKKVEIAAKLGKPSSDKNEGGYLSSAQATDQDLIRQAFEQLKDPQRRLIDEFFWFWPLRAGLAEDKALELLSKQNTEDALHIWKEKEKEGCCVSTHNLAIYYHLTVLDIERSLAGTTLAEEELDRCQSLWKNAFEKWQKLLEDVKFWSLLADRIRSLNDPRLTHETTQRIYYSLPKALVLINARLAARAAEAANKSAAERNIQLVKESGFEEGLLQDVLHEAALPIHERIKFLCEQVTPEARENPEQANQVLRRLLENVTSLLQAIDMLLPKNSVLRETLHDEVAGVIRNSTVAYGNRTEDWRECLWLTEQAFSLAVDASLRTHLESDAKFIKENLQQRQLYEELKRETAGNKAYYVQISADKIAVPPVCTCCLGQAQTEQQVSYSWEEQRGLSKYKRTRMFSFPLCWTCKYHQSELRRNRALLVLLTAAISTGVSFILGLVRGKTEYVTFLAFGGAISAGMLALLSRFIRLKPFAEEHAARGPAVSMNYASEHHATFVFLNPIYAWSFAHANNVEMTSGKARKYSRQPSLLHGRSAYQAIGSVALLALIGHSIAFAILDDQWTQPLSYRPAEQRVTHVSHSSLLVQIEAGKAKLRTMEAELKQWDSEVESLASELENLKAKIVRWEATMEQGVPVDRVTYSEAIKYHNELVQKHNSLITKYRLTYYNYERELKRVNEMIGQYNRTRY